MVDIYTGRVIRGSLSVRVVSLVNEWRVMHIEELTANWERARQRLSLNYIAPLE